MWFYELTTNWSGYIEIVDSWDVLPSSQKKNPLIACQGGISGDEE